MSSKAMTFCTGITVCAACMRASCWHGEFLCERAREAGTARVTREELRTLGLEHEDNWSSPKMAAVYGWGSSNHRSASELDRVERSLLAKVHDRAGAGRHAERGDEPGVGAEAD